MSSMTRRQPPPLPDSVFCCDCAELVETRNNAKPYHDPNRPLHDAIYKSFLSYTQRLSLANAQEVARLQKLAEFYEQAISEPEEEEDPEMTLLELIRGYNPDRQSRIPVRGTPSPDLAPPTLLFPVSPPTSPLNITQRTIKSDSLGFDICLPPFTPPSTGSNSLSTKPGQSFSDFFNNGAGVVPLLNSPPRLDEPHLSTPSITFPGPLPRNFNAGARLSDLARLLNSQESTATTGRVPSPLQSSSWISPPVSQSKLHMRNESGNSKYSRSSAAHSKNWRCIEPVTLPTQPPLGYALAGSCLPSLTQSPPKLPPWTANSLTLDTMDPPPFVPQRVLSPSNLINNPLTTSPPPPYAIHITSRVDFGQTEAHRYFVCPTDFNDDWPEVSLNQWFAAGVGFDFKAEKWDHKCLKHGRFFRMTLRPNLAMRGWGLGKGMEQVQKMAEAEKEKMNWEFMEL
ncbi:hypothetical protein CJF31_00007977 [Rutstroemia sp. NJR-2017a BVV2]|nr:hypothetical protein CJF31_00007977 [Rutstroemia sp. NJR-2017a BVV2]